ncbi:MAG: CpsD/CapB family tyrosine-protein kinase [Pseudomonadota bacterium]
MTQMAKERVVPLKVASSAADEDPQDVQDDALAERRLLTARSGKDMINAYNTVRARVFSHVQATGDRRLAVVSPVASDGKSLTAANLAISIARDLSHDAALVDFDLHRPSLADLFGLSVTRGVDDYLTGRETSPDALGHDTAFDGLTVYPVRRARARASELVATKRAETLIDSLAAATPSTVVVIDLPPLLATPDAQLLSQRAGGVLLVLRDGHTPADMIERAVELLDGSALVGAVLNESNDVANNYYAY